LALEFYLDLNGLFKLDKAELLETYFEDKVVVLPKVNPTTTGIEQPTEKKRRRRKKKLKKLKKNEKQTVQLSSIHAHMAMMTLL